MRVDPSPVIELNRAAAVAMRDGPLAGLTLVEQDPRARGDLADYHLAHSGHADLCRRLGRRADARRSYERALALARQEPERRSRAASPGTGQVREVVGFGSRSPFPFPVWADEASDSSENA